MTILEAAPPVAVRSSTGHYYAPTGHYYVRQPEPIDFPASEPLEEAVSETKRHLENRTALYLVLKEAFAATSSVGSDQFVYFDPGSARRCLSPDAFVKLGVPDEPFGVWKTWERGAPDLGVEIVSDSDSREEDWAEKLARYRAAGIREIVRFDPEDKELPIRVWDHVGGDVVERAGDDPQRLFCRALGLWWVVRGDPTYGPTLRLAKDREGREPLATPDEGRILAEAALRAAQQAIQVLEHEKLLAEEDAREAKQAKLDAEQARLDAEQAKLDAEQKLRDETEARQRAESEIERLKEALARRGG